MMWPKYLVLFLVIGLSTESLPGQVEKIDPDLLEHIGRDPDQLLKIGVSFKKNADLDSLVQFFESNQIHAKSRPGFVINLLQKQAKKAQQPVIDWYEQLPDNESREIHPLWIVNRIILTLEAGLIPDLAKINTIGRIEAETARFEPLEPLPSGPGSMDRNPLGPEPGLIAINAPKMWALGYTGRGRLLYNFDTGVWPDHPSVKDRYLGTRFPTEQCWLGYFRDYPNGLTSSHGTHTLGTMAGLDPLRADTVGMAFGAYWIANDYVVSTVDALPPVETLAYGFEWALDPDGNPETNTDVPDVINNSWRYSDDPTKEYCDSWVVDLMNAVEAAGIANVFSGGNAGPDNTTVSAPQRINTSVVNTFSVGSVDANQPAPYPISDFSSRGPTQCDGEGSLKVHPQVVAPGQNVRSAWGHDGYNTISGTSMSAPHVSGAVLLLKEAFPFLSGEEILWAIYETAVDYGIPGEDNTYGNGLVDVFGAFEYLKQFYQPVDPGAPLYDLDVSIPSGKNEKIVCEDRLDVEINLSNRGTELMHGIELNLWLGATEDTLKYIVTDTIWPGSTIPVFAAGIDIPSTGDWVLFAKAGYPDSELHEYDLYNNQVKFEFIRSEKKSPVIIEDFEQGLAMDRWIVDNPDNDIGWDTISTNGLPSNKVSATLQFYQYTPRERQKDALILSNVELPADKPTILSYDLAYQPFIGSTTIRDTFRIMLLANCAEYPRDTLIELAGKSLNVSDSVFINFKPKYPGHWRRDSLNLQNYAGETVSLVFEGTNMKWNNLYLDNVMLVPADLTGTAAAERTRHDIQLFPNPAKSYISIEGDRLGLPGIKMSLFDVFGKMRQEKLLSGNRLEFIETLELPQGMYYLLLSGTEIHQSIPFVITGN